jgi:hypothetical protein
MENNLIEGTEETDDFWRQKILSDISTCLDQSILQSKPEDVTWKKIYQKSKLCRKFNVEIKLSSFGTLDTSDIEPLIHKFIEPYIHDHLHAVIDKMLNDLTESIKDDNGMSETDFSFPFPLSTYQLYASTDNQYELIGYLNPDYISGVAMRHYLLEHENLIGSSVDEIMTALDDSFEDLRDTMMNQITHNLENYFDEPFVWEINDPYGGTASEIIVKFTT